MEIQLLQTEEDFRRIKTEWDNLLEKSDNQSIFLTWEWLYHWWMHFKVGKELFILTVRNKETNEMMGIACF